jgi:hypothetical protein
MAKPNSTENTPTPAVANEGAPVGTTNIQIRDDQAVANYANFCRVSGSPEELILDFGLNSQPVGVSRDPVQVKQRIIMNYYTAKRLVQLLHRSVTQHEAAFGVLETNIQKRFNESQQQRAG